MSSTSSSPTSSLPKIQLKPVEGFDPEKFRFRGASDHDFDTVIRDPCQLWDGDRLVAIYLDMGPMPGFAKMLGTIKYQDASRTEGLKTKSKTFGFLPRIAVRQNFCRPTIMMRENPTAFAELMSLSQQMSDRLREHNPQQWEWQQKVMEQVHPAWRLPGGVFTSGIVNQNSWLGYHFDAGNFDGAWSCMVTTSLDIQGGHLVFPQYRAALSVEGNRLFMFAGARDLHGVSPLHARNAHAFRYSVVYYALQQMCHCLEPAEEIRRARQDDVTRSRNTKEERELQMRRGKPKP